MRYPQVPTFHVHDRFAELQVSSGVDHLRMAVDAAVCGGEETDTVAAIGGTPRRMGRRPAAEMRRAFTVLLMCGVIRLRVGSANQLPADRAMSCASATAA